MTTDTINKLRIQPGRRKQLLIAQGETRLLNTLTALNGYIEGLMRDEFYGRVELIFEKGKVVVAKQTATLKFNSDGSMGTEEV